MDQLHTANKVCGGCCAISLNTVDTESSVSPTKGDVLDIFLLVQQPFPVFWSIPEKTTLAEFTKEIDISWVEMTRQTEIAVAEIVLKESESESE